MIGCTPIQAGRVLRLLTRELASLIAAQALRDVEPDDPELEPEHTPAERVDDSELPQYHWSGTESDAITAGRALFDAVADQVTVGEVLAAIGALSPDDLAVIVLERALATIAARRRPS